MKKISYLFAFGVFVTSLVLPTTSAYADCSNFTLGNSNIRPGSRGESVRLMQSALNTILDESLVLDGIYGKNTKGLVMRMQTNIGATADGIVGPKTATKINEYLNNHCNGTDAVAQKKYTNEVKTYTRKEAEVFLKTSISSVGGTRLTKEDLTFASDALDSSDAKSSSAPSFSSTNIQEQGVDESDIIKTDGEYIYTLSGKNIDVVATNSIGNLSKVSTIKLSGDAHDMYLADDRLVVMMYTYEEKQYASAKLPSGTQVSTDYRPATYTISFVRTAIYNVANPAQPVLEQTYDFEGSYLDSRIINGYLYVISQKYLYDACCTFIPMVKENGKVRTIANTVSYFDMPYHDYTITQIHGIAIANPKEIKEANYLLSGGYALYASDEAFYLSYTDYQYPESPVIDDATINDDLTVRVALLPTGTERTVIHKITAQKGVTRLATTGFVPGTALNQFAFSEYDGNLRVATTTGNNWNGDNSQNNLYVLDGEMKTIGKLEGLAKGERIYSVRFVGERAYMVTFKQVDPLFVIDLVDPKKPTVLGKLKIPGFSSYLHPYSDSLLMGIGQDTTTVKGRTTTTGLKVSLFDVSQVSRPREIDSVVIGGGASSSEALYNHKAFLFSKEKNLLVIPFQDYDDQVTKQFSGAAVFSINEKEINLRGKISHADQNVWESSIQRSLYIDENLYTMSSKFLQSHELATLKAIDSFGLTQTSSNGGYPYPAVDMIQR